MKNKNEITELQILLRNAESNEKHFKSKSYIYSIINIIIFAAITYCYLDVRAGNLSGTTAILIVVVLAIISGIILTLKIHNKYYWQTSKYLNVEKIKNRINEINT